MLHPFTKWYDTFQCRLAPELTRLPDLGERLKVSQRSWWKAGGLIFVVICLLLNFLLVLLTALLCLAAREFLPPYFAESSRLQYMLAVIAFLLLFFAIVLFLRRRYRRAVRMELRRYGVALCVRCGYDLTGNESGVCSECGVPCRAGARVK